MRKAPLLLALAPVAVLAALAACGGEEPPSEFDEGSDAGAEASVAPPGTFGKPPGGGDASTGDASAPPRCGNGLLERGEGCDDGNEAGSDGCSATCTVEPGYACAKAGVACAAAACGDGIVAGTEDCDDGNTKDGDGCAATCRLEDGFKCPDAGKPCAPTTCGDNAREGTEQCDDGNTLPYDGCSPTCTVEPKCAGGTCMAFCGDGLKFPGEACDDGNNRDGDGCAKDCTLEPGFQCTLVVAQPPAQLDLPIIYRDFRAKGAADGNGHPDFEAYSGSGATPGLVKAVLGANGKPELLSTTGPDSGDGNKIKTQLTSAADFAEWFAPAARNKTIASTMTLTGDGAGSYVFDSNLPPYGNYCFFPIDGMGWNDLADVTSSASETCKATQHNFWFTSELRYWFTYRASAAPTLEFSGDDDVWVFVNGKLALDLGGLHPRIEGSFTLDAAKAASLGLTDGGMYEIALFHAERHTGASNFKLTLRGFERARTECASACGDGVKTRTEQCDDGQAKNTGGYGKCNPDCTRAPRCGDGVLQPEHGEQCDDGNLVDGDGCSPTCRKVSGGPR